MHINAFIGIGCLFSMPMSWLLRSRIVGSLICNIDLEDCWVLGTLGTLGTCVNGRRSICFISFYIYSFTGGYPYEPESRHPGMTG